MAASNVIHQSNLVSILLNARLIIVVCRRKVLNRLGHQTLFLGNRSLFVGFLARRAAVTLPHEDGELTHKHTHGAGGQTGQDSEDGRDNNEAHNAVQGPFPGLVELIAEVRRRRVRAVVAVMTVRFASVGWQERRRRVRGFRSVGTALSLEHADDAFLSRSEHGPDTVDQETSQAPSVSAALLPRFSVGSHLDVGSGHVEGAFGVMDKGDGDRVEGNRVAVKIENCESNLDHIERLLGRRREWHHFDGVAQWDGLGFFAISHATLNGRDLGRRSRREDLMVVGQEKAVIDGEFQRLVLLVEIRKDI
jgi:hypothetical protein